ncbi:ABC transporter ATP-binding protein [Shouchella lehensis]|uniref:Multidrug ABC transporter ATP-binding protein n=1 Tax=Shouchella lehensis G1 TaxID=1246626 RepID=A0A060LZ41_9BACI|nr:ABC transporter ATP-binding protein [Shouchella lehensis]AIC93064.1 multidrug ABC transporter ATP-binding protein [Shouchella lehensis G1]
METLSYKQFVGIFTTYRPSRMLLTMAFTLSLVQTGLSLVIPLIAMDLVNLLIEESFNGLLLVGLVLLFVTQVVLSGLSLYLMIYIGEKVIVRLRDDLWNRVVRLPLTFYDKNNSGEIMSRITNDTNVMKNFFIDHLVPFVTGLISIIGSFIILFVLNWSMALLFLIIFPLAFFVIKPLGKRMYSVSRDLQQETASFQGDLSRVLGDVRLVKFSVAEKQEAAEGTKRATKLYHYGLSTGKILAIVAPLMTAIILLVLVMIIGYGGYQVATGSLSAGALVAVVFYIFQIINPLSMMAQFFTQAQKAMGATERVYLLLQEEHEGSRDPVKEPVRKKQHTFRGIRFSNVGFSYDPERSILKNISFTAEKNHVTAIVGPSGTGKTTMFSLVERFYAVEEGDILFNNDSIYSYTLEEWRRKIAYVSQESPIMSGSIRKNVTYGLKQAKSDQTIYEALGKANLMSDIMGLPKGLDTEVGERGIRLSGGQRQRMAIARAILRDADILLLDEATAHLDGQSEALVQDALNELMRERTTLIIAHRIATVQNANNIVVVENGEVTDQGIHEDLYKRNTLYHQLVNRQMLSNNYGA